MVAAELRLNPQAGWLRPSQGIQTSVVAEVARLTAGCVSLRDAVAAGAPCQGVPLAAAAPYLAVVPKARAATLELLLATLEVQAARALSAAPWVAAEGPRGQSWAVAVVAAAWRAQAL